MSTAWSKHVLRDVLEASKDNAYGPTWYPLATPGRRRGEVLELRWRDLHEDNNSISWKQTVGSADDENGHRQVIVQDSLKGGQGHHLAGPRHDAHAVRKERKAYREDRLRFGHRWQELDLVFYKGMRQCAVSSPACRWPVRPSPSSGSTGSTRICRDDPAPS